MRRGEFSHRSIRALSHRRVWNRNTECLIPISFRMLYTYSTRTLRHRRVGSGNKWDYWKDCCELAAHLPCGVVYSIPTLSGNLALDSSGHAHICWMNLQVALRPGKRGNVIAELALSNEYSDLLHSLSSSSFSRRNHRSSLMFPEVLEFSPQHFASTAVVASPANEELRLAKSQ